MFAIEIMSLSTSKSDETVYATCYLTDRVDGIIRKIISFSVDVPKDETSTLLDYEEVAKAMALDIVEQICADIIGTA